MVKKLLVVSALVVVAAAGFGLAFGSQLSPADSPGPTDADSDPASTPTPTPDPEPEPDSEPTPDSNTVTSTPTPEPTDEPTRTSIPAREFTESDIADYLVTYINAERSERGLDELSTDGRTADQLAKMARSHSEDMAAEGETIHKIDGKDSADRYEKAGLYKTCEFKAVGKSYVVTPDDNKFEALGRTVAGHTYDGGQFNADDQAVAQSIFESWLDAPTYQERLFRDGITRLGIGVEVTDTGYVYVTATTCG